MEYDVKEILRDSVEKGASDIFIIAGSPYAFKIKGHIVRQSEEKLNFKDCENIISQIYELNPHEDYNHFKETGDDDFSFSVSGVGRFRVNAYKQRNSAAAVLRVVNFGIPDPAALHVPEEVMDLCEEDKGMILVTGPAGSGKSTTLACMIDKINMERNAHIITLEDPIEYIHNHKNSLVSQREIYHDTKDYLSALRAALRETPEVILLGEMRDTETIQAALTAAETGHLIFSTLHTLGAVNTIDRIIDSFENNQQQVRVQLSEVLCAVVSERLVPAINGGYVPVFEVMRVNTAVKTQIRENRLHMIENTMAASKGEGMLMMDDSLLDSYKKGLISKETALNFASHPETLSRKM
ncbi:MAG: PilT/PilU family type 4a pilus ATPase [Erysipelotrichaceae bacterium]|nr:PilT/PilU family type 4a pilus ATPase [Erysipelotrichaceae bacterium]